MVNNPLDMTGHCKDHCQDLCDDNNMCTVTHKVSNNQCSCLTEPGQINCDDGDPSTEDRCEPTIGCEHLVTMCHVPQDNPLNFHGISINKAAKQNHMVNNPLDMTGHCKDHCQDLCDDNNMCTVTHKVSNNQCSCLTEPGQINCDDGDPSTEDRCEPTIGCVHLEELHFSVWTWEVSHTLILEGVRESQVVWDVAFASRKTVIEAECLGSKSDNLTDLAKEAPTSAAAKSELDNFLGSCFPGSVLLHATVPRSTQTICFDTQENCRPVICYLGGDQDKVDLDGISKLSYAPGNNELLFGLSKNCKIDEPYYWKEYVDVVIGSNARFKWSNDDLYRMDFDGDGLTNIIEYYGLRIGDMYVDIAHGGHPHVSVPDWPYQFPSSATDPYSVDTDGDLLTDTYELLYGMDARKPNDIFADTDGEGLTDFQEQISRTNPFRNDTDGDSVNDFKEVQDATNPIDDSDFLLEVVPQGNLRRRLQPSQTIPITLIVGDHSGSHSERYVIRVGSVEHAATQFGVVSSGTYNFRAGSYPVSVHHIDSKLSSPDYDYTAQITWPKTQEFEHFEVSIDDPEILLGRVDYSSSIDRTLGKRATLRIKRGHQDCHYETCVECNTNTTCQWNRGTCEVYDSILLPRDTADDCACKKCEIWAKEEQMRGLQWIDDLPQCPCRVRKDTMSSTAVSINELSFGGGVTRSSTSIEPDSKTDVVWDNDLNCNPNTDCSAYHPGAYGCLRAPAFRGPHGQQCCYASGGEYIPAGTKAAGTPDYQQGVWNNVYDHYKADVEPFQWCCDECEVNSMCDLYIGADTSSPGVRADIRGCEALSLRCGDGYCDSENDETILNCPEDCDLLGSKCGDGYCDHNETSTNCLKDCPIPSSPPPKLPSNPEKLDDDFLELASRCATLSNLVYYKYPSIEEVRDNYWQYPPYATDDNVADAALISREYEKNRCIIALRGTNIESWEDKIQVLNPWIRWVKDGNGNGCNVREGWAQAFLGVDSSGELIEGHYGKQLHRRIEECISDNLKLVFTGHSQGGALALIGHLVYNTENPLSITFAAPPTFVSDILGDTDNPCPVIKDDQTYRFINTEHDEIALNYDVVPFVGEAIEQILTLATASIQSLVLNTIFGFDLSAQGLTIGEIRRQIGRHKGPVAILPSEADNNIKVYQNQATVGEPPLWMFDIVDIGLNDGGFSAHKMTTYLKKINALGAVETDGFKHGMQCNYDVECASTSCKSPESKSCLKLLHDGTYDCDDHEDCVSGRCNKKLIGYEICEQKLNVGDSCLQDADCKSSYCHLFNCAAKLDNTESCLNNQHCKSGRCDNFFCKPTITESHTDCDDDEDCWTGRCKKFLNPYYKDYCAYKIFDGSDEKCERDAECADGSFCNDKNKCQKKLGLGKTCDDHIDCQTGRCAFPARKVCY